jgi:hypothetical protein
MFRIRGLAKRETRKQLVAGPVYCSILKTEAVSFPETSVNLYQIAWRYIPKDRMLFIITAMGIFKAS